MKILHGTWIPDQKFTFTQKGNFYIWIETVENKSPKRKRKSSELFHPYSLRLKELEEFLSSNFGVKSGVFSSKYFLLPTANQKPLPSLEVLRYLETDVPENYELQHWQVDCYEAKGLVSASNYSRHRAINVIKLLNDIHFIAIHNLADIQLSADLLFWHHYTQSFKQIILKEQYIPALRYHETIEPSASTSVSTEVKRGRKSKNATKYEIYGAWDILSESYEADIQQYIEYMPLACVSGFSQPSADLSFFDRETLLRHFSECVLADLIAHTPSTAKFDQQISGSILEYCFSDHVSNQPDLQNHHIEIFYQWQAWQQKISLTQTDAPFYLCFQLQAPIKTEEPWSIQFQIAPKQDPSLKLSLVDYWRMTAAKKKTLQKQFGKDLEQNLLLLLGYAARIYSKVWEGMETEQPTSISLDLDAAFEFLKESAWILEDAGYKLIVPSWWTPAGRRRANLRLKASAPKSGKSEKSKSYFGLDQLVEYQYELSIAGENVSEQEWQALVDAKVPLVKFRGEWIELDRDKMQEMLVFWQKQGETRSQMSLIDFIKQSASEDLEVDRDDALTEMLEKLNDKSQFIPVENPKLLKGELREYQKRGVAAIPRRIRIERLPS